MPVLSNPKHERFAQELAKGKTAFEAHEAAGYKPDRGNASKLAANPDVVERVQQITAKAAEKVGITKERVMAELGKIGFADIRKAVEWHGQLVREEDNPDGGEVLVVKNIFTNHVLLKDSDQIDDDTAAAIAEVKQSPTGGLSIKFHDKQAALMAIGKELGMFKEKVEHSGTLVLESLVGASMDGEGKA
jgi:phage terminase small subunit